MAATDEQVETTENEATQDGAQNEQANQTPNRDGDGGDLQAQLERLKAEQVSTAAALKKANAEAAQRRKQIEAYEAAEAQRKQAEMTEIEKAQAQAEQARKQYEALRAQSRQVAAESAIINEAAKLNFSDPADAVTLLFAAVEFDENGKPVNVQEAVKALSESKPYLLKSTKMRIPQPNATNPDASEAERGETEAQFKERFFGPSSHSIFDPTWAQEHGGGVISKK